MKRFNLFPFVRARSALVLAAAALWACTGGSEMAEMPGMEGDHAAHMPAMPAHSEIDTMPALGRGLVHLTSEEERALGVTYTAVERLSASREIRTVGRIDAPEGNIADITPKTGGFVEELLVATTGEAVRRGQSLLTIYSPALVAAQEELLTARRLAAQVDPAATEAWSSAQSMRAAAASRGGTSRKRRSNGWSRPAK